MATGMFGVHTDELRAIAEEFGDGSSTASEAKVITAREVDGVMWMCIDAERFKTHDAVARALEARLEALLAAERRSADIG
ncbi:hypothetical protein JRG19_01395 [Pseudoclavibacter alba]|uniref:Uncharacterized protein n=1 Tax=Pseudoclavibacter albus TaxID=272241 RepID=A0ABT2HVH3_9MICO|nr:hypothetical protein [Pseudoclavibacter alba]MBN6777205.1 hypothetical protein [Pseudoclavibacter alba]MCT2042318.1 hypothetical protein [Pseudoclavibacter alba]